MLFYSNGLLLAQKLVVDERCGNVTFLDYALFHLKFIALTSFLFSNGVLFLLFSCFDGLIIIFKNPPVTFGVTPTGDRKHYITV